VQFYELSSLFAIKSGRVTAADLLPLVEASDFITASSQVEISSGYDWQDWVDSGQAAQGVEIAMNLLKNVSPALLGASIYPRRFPADVDSGWCVLSLDKVESDCSITFFSKYSTHRIPSVRKFTQYLSDGDYSSAVFCMTPIMKRDSSEGQMDLEFLLSNDLEDVEIDGTWFDSDNDWGYEEWSVVFNSWGYENPDRFTAWCIRMEDFEKQILNWSKTSINDLLNFINAKV